METPVFEEFEPASDCDCPGCARGRPAVPRSPAVRPAARRTLAVATAASAALGAGPAAAAPAAVHAPHRPDVPAGEEPGTPQGKRAPLHGPGGRPAEDDEAAGITRAEIIKRAKTWVAAKVPYSMKKYWSDGYRQDCSGYVSMAWHLPENEWTGSLGQFGVRITKEELQPGDILLFHNTTDPEKGSHVVIFGGWTDYTHTHYTAYEQTPPHTRRKATPYAYWSNSDRFLPFRYKNVVSAPAGAEPAAAEPGRTGTQGYPGPAYFGPGANNKHVARLGRMLVRRGAGRFYGTGPGPRWTDADRRATRAFQLAQGWRDADADGLPGPLTWQLLVSGRGRDIPATAGGPPAHRGAGFPGRDAFRPGAHSDHVTRLGRQLVKKGFGAHYTTGPGPRWSEADRRNVAAFQRAQGWRGRAADGRPGPETWRRLFS
ncbi:membrane protein [Streptomyces fumigatiscleroticus]|nr:membrane protein [Streptomyces fumigatiscleroticus]